jgi:hypothetical protein
LFGGTLFARLNCRRAIERRCRLLDDARGGVLFRFNGGQLACVVVLAEVAAAGRLIDGRAAGGRWNWSAQSVPQLTASGSASSSSPSFPPARIARAVRRGQFPWPGVLSRRRGLAGRDSRRGGRRLNGLGAAVVRSRVMLRLLEAANPSFVEVHLGGKRLHALAKMLRVDLRARDVGHQAAKDFEVEGVPLLAPKNVAIKKRMPVINAVFLWEFMVSPVSYNVANNGKLCEAEFVRTDWPCYVFLPASGSTISSISTRFHLRPLLRKIRLLRFG